MSKKHGNKVGMIA